MDILFLLTVAFSGVVVDLIGLGDRMELRLWIGSPSLGKRMQRVVEVAVDEKGTKLYYGSTVRVLSGSLRRRRRKMEPWRRSLW